MKTKFYLGVDVGGTKIAVALTEIDGKILFRDKAPTPPNATVKEIATLICNMILKLMQSAQLTNKNIAGVGVGIPGIVNPANGFIIRTPNMNISGSNLKKQLELKLKIKCYFGNDANLGVLGEKWLGAAKKSKNAIGIFIGTGVGGGIIINNSLLTGTSGGAAEIGHMIIQDNGPKCTCSNRGCLEALAGRWAIERDIKQAIKNGTKTVISKYLNKNSNKIKSKILLKALQKNDKLTLSIINEASKQLGIACVSLRHTFDPEIIVLGGGVMQACADYILPIVRKEVMSDEFFVGIRKCKIEPSKLGDDAVILGAVALVKQNLF